MKMMKSIFATVVAMAGCLWVDAEVALPISYSSLEWIQSSGTQWIDTGALATPQTQIEAHFNALTSSRSWGAFFGVSGSNAPDSRGDGLVLRYYGTTTSLQGFFGNKGSVVSADVGTNADVTVVLKTGQFTLNGQTQDLPTAQAPYAGNVYLFSANKAGDAWCQQAMRLYSFKMFEVVGDVATPVRDFVPCRDPDGVVGLWDKVEGRFYPNNGSGAFLASDGEDVPRFLNWIESSGTQWIDTGVSPTMQTKVEAHFNSLTCTRSGGWGAHFGVSGSNAPERSGDALILRFSGTSSALQGFFGDTGGVTFSNMANQDIVATVRVGEITLNDFSRTIASTKAPYAGHVYLFAANQKGSVWCQQAMRLYSFKMSEVDGENETMTCDVVPYHTADGQVGLWDRVTETFLPNLGTGTFTYGIAFEREGTVLKVFDGTLSSNDLTDDLTLVDKEDWGTLEACSVRTYPNLTIGKGAFSLLDGEKNEYGVDGTLTLKSGAKIKLDVTEDGCDRLTATALDLEAASVERPVRIEVVLSSGTSLVRPLSVLRANGLTADMAAKFVVVGANNIGVRVEGEELVLFYADPTVATVSVWTGAGKNPLDIADPANWSSTNGFGVAITAIPSADTYVVLPDECTFSCTNGAPFACRQIQMPATLGADCDWRGIPVPMSGTVDLKGHKLFLLHPQGDLTITDTSCTKAYQRLAYIESDGTAAYVNTGYRVTPGTTVEAHFNALTCTRSGGWGAFFGVSSSSEPDKSGQGLLARFFNNTTTLQAFYGNTGSVTFENLANTDVKAVLQAGRLSLNDQVQTIATTKDPYAGNFYIFCANNAGNAWCYQAMRLYSLKIYEGTTLVHDYVPARRLSDGVGGLLDVVNGGEDFKVNANSSGAFLLGPVAVDDVLEATGELHLDVPEGETETGAALKIRGAVKLVKEGSGTYKPALSNQLYFGGTDIRGGTVIATASGTERRLGAAGNVITVGAGGTLDMGATYDWHEYAFTLEGGCWANKTALASCWTHSLATTVRVTEDSSIDFNSWGVIGYSSRPTTLDLAGHTLKMNTQGGSYFTKTTATRGTIEIHGPIEFSSGDFHGPETTLDIYGPLSLGSSSTVHVGTYIAHATTTEAAYDGNLLVYGRFKPVTSNFWGCILKNGAVLDLSACDEDWSITGTLVGKDASFTKTTASFEEGANIHVDVGARRLRDGMRLVAWDGIPNATFTLADQPHYFLEVRKDGLYCLNNGTIIFVR